MPGIAFSGNTMTPPIWMGEAPIGDRLRHGALELNPAAFESSDAVLVKANGVAAAGATAVTVDALPGALPSGAFLNFGSFAPVTVTVADADVNAGETTIGVNALSGPIPAGTRLEFSGAGAGYAQTTADAAAGATSLTVEALPEDIDNGATATFLGGTIQARLTAAAAAGATSLTVDELQFAIPDNAEANYYSGPLNVKRIESGILVGRTYAEREAGTPFEPWAENDDEVVLIAFDVKDANTDNSFTGLDSQFRVIENFLPGWANYSAAKKAAVRATYRTITSPD